MSSKLGLILSMVFVALFLCTMMDMVYIQNAFSSLDAKGISIGYKISKHGVFDVDFIEQLENEYKVKVEPKDDYIPVFGDFVHYSISTFYKPFIISNEEILISINRTTVIGYYA